MSSSNHIQPSRLSMAKGCKRNFKHISSSAQLGQPVLFQKKLEFGVLTLMAYNRLENLQKIPGTTPLRPVLGQSWVSQVSGFLELCKKRRSEFLGASPTMKFARRTGRLRFAKSHLPTYKIVAFPTPNQIIWDPKTENS